MKEMRSQVITKRMVFTAWKLVKKNQGGFGVDRISLKEYEGNLKNNLYKLWIRLNSGSYHPLPVKVVAIPKGKDKIRKLGIPTVEDRIAQMIVKQYLEPCNLYNTFEIKQPI